MKTRLPARVRGAWLQSNSALAECPFGQTRLSPQLQRLRAQRVRNSGCAEVPELRVANLPYNALEPQGVRVFYVGVDLGKRQDHTAIAVVERRERYQGAHQMPQFDSAAVRHVERMPLGTPYPAAVARVGEIVGSGELAGRC